MKTCLVAFFVVCCCVCGFSQNNPTSDSLGLPGDNLNLYAVLDLFRQSETLEIFEKKLNDESNRINNLDLNNDNQIDYIRVLDNPHDNAHSIVLQIPVNANENQDVAVIEVEKDNNGNPHIQVIGNEDLYGKDYIIEPQPTSGSTNNTPPPGNTPNPGYIPVSNPPVVQYLYNPGYVVYVSPWRWYSYPTYWHPWRPWYWNRYSAFHYNYYPHYQQYYHRTVVYRNVEVHNYYLNRRTSSTVVINNRNNGLYRQTYLRSEANNKTINRPAQNNPAVRNNLERGNRQHTTVPRAGQPEGTIRRPDYNKPANRETPRSGRSAAPKNHNRRSKPEKK